MVHSDSKHTIETSFCASTRWSIQKQIFFLSSMQKWALLTLKSTQKEKAFQDKITLPCNSFQGQKCIEPILTSSAYLLSSTNCLMLLLSSVLPFPIHQHQPQKQKKEGRQERWNNWEWESQTSAFWVQRSWTEQRRLGAHSCSTAGIPSSQVALNDTNRHGEY